MDAWIWLDAEVLRAVPGVVTTHEIRPLAVTRQMRPICQ